MMEWWYVPGASINSFLNNGWFGLAKDNNLISDKMPKLVSKNGNKPNVNTADSKADAIEKPVKTNISMMTYFSNDKKINKNVITILTAVMPTPARTIAKRSLIFVKHAIAANCEKKKYIPASILSDPGISPLKMTVPSKAYKMANTIANLSSINCLISKTPVATGTAK